MRQLALAVALWSIPALAQTKPPTKADVLREYIDQSVTAAQFALWENAEPADRKLRGDQSMESLSPDKNPYPFVAYVMATRFSNSAALSSLAAKVAGNQLNKMIGSPSGASGTTSLLSNSAAADILSFATEYGAIRQSTSGATTTVRGNLAGIAGLLAGNPYLGCQSSVDHGCSFGSRLARNFSASLSIDATAAPSDKSVSGTNAATGAATSGSILGDGNRMTGWSARYDFTKKTLYDTRRAQQLLTRWASAVQAMAKSPNEATLSAAVVVLGSEFQKLSSNWRPTFQATLQNAPKDHLAEVLEAQLDEIIAELVTADPQFVSKVQTAQNAIEVTFEDRDAALRELQSNKFSVEFNSLHPLGQPNLSNIRAIYSYQPPTSKLLLTANFAAEWYDNKPSGTTGRLRDAQAAVQADRPLGEIPNFGTAVLTAAFYYQWMRENAAIEIGPGNNAPNTGIVLPGAAATLLAPKGNIAIGQLKVTIPLKNGALKIPISFTWSNRTELINAPEKKGQIGLALDLDSFFAH